MRQTIRPYLYDCPSPDASKTLFKGRSIHEWRYSSNWNGNNKKVLPFVESSSGIARSGWRCYHCGKFVWDESDQMFAAGLALSWGMIALPEFPGDGDLIDKNEFLSFARCFPGGDGSPENFSVLRHIHLNYWIRRRHPLPKAEERTQPGGTSK